MNMDCSKRVPPQVSKGPSSRGWHASTDEISKSGEHALAPFGYKGSSLTCMYWIQVANVRATGCCGVKRSDLWMKGTIPWTLVTQMCLIDRAGIRSFGDSTH